MREWHLWCAAALTCAQNAATTGSASSPHPAPKRRHCILSALSLHTLARARWSAWGAATLNAEVSDAQARAHERSLQILGAHAWPAAGELSPTTAPNHMPRAAGKCTKPLGTICGSTLLGARRSTDRPCGSEGRPEPRDVRSGIRFRLIRALRWYCTTPAAARHRCYKGTALVLPWWHTHATLVMHWHFTVNTLMLHWYRNTDAECSQLRHCTCAVVVVTVQ